MAAAPECNKDGSERGSATAAALVLATAAFATTWCAYQASLWSGARTERTLHAGTTSLAAQDAQAEGNRLYDLDASMFGAYLDAKTSNRERLASFVYERFRPEMRAGVDAWLATGPFDSAGSSSGPFTMPQYGVAEWSKAAALRKEASEHTQEALRANSVNDDYVFGTVLFAAVSLITGAASGLATRVLRRTVLLFGVFALAGCLFWVLSQPIAHRESAQQRNVVSDTRAAGTSSARLARAPARVARSDRVWPRGAHVPMMRSESREVVIGDSQYGRVARRSRGQTFASSFVQIAILPREPRALARVASPGRSGR